MTSRDFLAFMAAACIFHTADPTMIAFAPGPAGGGIAAQWTSNCRLQRTEAAASISAPRPRSHLLGLRAQDAAGVLQDEKLSERRARSVRRRYADASSNEALNELMQTVSRHKLDLRDIEDYSGEGLFDRIARICCRLDGVVPRKELHENWEVANRISSHFPGTTRVADLAGGNGLLGWMLLLIHDEQHLAAQLHNHQSVSASASSSVHGGKTPQAASPGRGGHFGAAGVASGTFNRPRLSVLCVDKVKPPSACQLTDAFLGEYPWLRSRHRFAEGDLSDLVPGERGPSTLMVSLHGCGRLSDRVIELAHTSKASLALMPCCQNIAGMAQSLTISSHPRGDGAIDHVRRMAKRTSVADAVDAARVATMRSLGYDVAYSRIPEEITPKNRIIFARRKGDVIDGQGKGEGEGEGVVYDQGPMWPAVTIPRNAWAWSGGRIVAESARVEARRRREIDWGGNRRRDNFMEAVSMRKRASRADVQVMMLDGVSKAVEGMLEQEFELASVYLDMRRFFVAPAHGEGGWLEALSERVAKEGGELWRVVSLELAPEFVTTPEEYTGEVKAWDWAAVARTAGGGPIKFTCRKAHIGWRPILPPDIENLARDAFSEWSETGVGDGAGGKCEGGAIGPGAEVRMWMTDSYILAAVKPRKADDAEHVRSPSVGTRLLL